MEELLHLVQSTALDRDRVSASLADIHLSVLSKSQSLDAANFTTIHSRDLELLFAAYDSTFFDGQIKNALGATPLYFRLSQRMTSAGGKTARYLDRGTGTPHYEIAASTTILFACFDGEDHRPITASGILCHDRLETLQRIMEHEIVHLIELLVWDDSSCSQSRFHSISHRFFGHTENRHQLITPKEKAFAKFGIRPGMFVRFRFDGVQHTGLVNRIHKRATVLVEDQRGERYSDGKHYAKFYVPIELLEAID